MVLCTGPIYSSNDYAAQHAKLSRDELVKLNAGLDQLGRRRPVGDRRDAGLDRVSSAMSGRAERKFYAAGSCRATLGRCEYVVNDPMLGFPARASPIDRSALAAVTA